MAQYTQGITIDGTYFDVPLINIKRTGDFLDKYANRTEDGVLHRELIGTYFNYTMNFGIIEDTETYVALWDKLSEPVEFHEFTLPDANRTYAFTGYVSSLSDEMRKIYGNSVQYENLTCEFIARQPARRPS